VHCLLDGRLPTHSRTTMTSNDTSWFPVRGRHHVEVAASVTRALKARKEKGENPPPAAKRSKIPVRDFHSLRCLYLLSAYDLAFASEFLVDNFHPPSLDRDGVGSITVRTGKDITSVAVERSSSQVWMIDRFADISTIEIINHGSPARDRCSPASNTQPRIGSAS
jgi:hypothetical protein